MYSKKNKISRADFIKTSGAVLGGVVTLSHYACSGDFRSLKELMIEGKTAYNIVIPKLGQSQRKKCGAKIANHICQKCLNP